MTELPDRIEHTVLGPRTQWADVAKTLDAAIQYGMRACVPPCYVDRATAYAPTVDVTTVVGFPHGHHETAIKCEEAETAWQAGAAEVDVVCNIGSLLDRDEEAVRTELEDVVASVPIPVKVIVESPLLDGDQRDRACAAASDADAAYVKTATGFSEGGATIEDVSAMAEYLPVKASGGIRSWSFAEELLDAGAERIGTSSGVDIVEEYRDANE
jgi:deoxyribose-phosphate aldolase